MSINNSVDEKDSDVEEACGGTFLSRLFFLVVLEGGNHPTAHKTGERGQHRRQA